MDGKFLTLIPAGETLGQIQLQVNVVKDGKAIQDNFQVSAIPKEGPRINQPLADVVTQEDINPSPINLGTLFTDDAVDDTQIEITLGEIENPTLLAAEVSNKTLSITLAKDQFGETNFPLIGLSKGMKVSSQLKVTVEPVDDPPFLASPVEDQDLTLGAAP